MQSLKGERALPWGWEHAGRVKVLGNNVLFVQAFEARHSQHHGVTVTGGFGPHPGVRLPVGFSRALHHHLPGTVLFEPFHTGDAGAHITADINDFKVGAQQPQLRCTARRPGADAGAGGEGIKSQLITRNKRIARVFAFEGCRDHQPGTGS